MSRTTSDENIPITPDHARIAAVESLIGLAQSQIAARISRAANIDTQALGLIGLDAALTAIVIAAQGLLGPHYWVAIPGLAISLLIAGSVLAVTRFDLGPKPEQPYEQIEAAAISGEEAIAKLLMNLVETDKTNQRPRQSKAIRLAIALGVLALTILYTTLQLAL